MRPQILLLTIFLAVLPLSAIARPRATVGPKYIGFWEPIKDLHDPHVQEMGNYAVDTYNCFQHTGLVFDDIRKGSIKINGEYTDYYLYLLVAQSESPRYVALLAEKPGYRELLSFAPDTSIDPRV